MLHSFFCNDTATPELYPLSLHDALPIFDVATNSFDPLARTAKDVAAGAVLVAAVNATFVGYLVFAERLRNPSRDRKSTRLNSSHPSISYAVFCLKKKTKKNVRTSSHSPH